MSILDKIINNKRIEVEERKSLYPVKLLERSIYFNTKPVSLKQYLLRPDKSGIIAEFKTQSPSKGIINAYADVEKVSVEYMQAGASALSVLTDQKFFGGSFENLTKARKNNYCPILQKDFIIDEYQIVEAKSIGADAILLIADILSKTDLNRFSTLAKSLGLEILFEMHDSLELSKLNDQIEIIGVNNRNLKTFQVDIESSIRISDLIPNNLIKVSESGIHSVNDIVLLKQHAYNGFLIGENFMKTNHPGKACKDFIDEINKKQKELQYETQSVRVE